MNHKCKRIETRSAEVWLLDEYFEENYEETRNRFNYFRKTETIDDFDMDIDLDGGSDFLEKVTTEKVDDVLSKDLMRLSVADRISLAEELHGVRNLAIEENGDELTTERISRSLAELNQVLEHEIPAHEKAAFLKAKSFGETAETYVNDVGFRLRFLRCRLFKVKEAARLLVDHLELVRELYGDICLRRPIRLDDIQTSKEERNAFRLGYCQLLPFGDRAGRRIIMVTTDALEYSTLIRVRMVAMF